MMPHNNTTTILEYKDEKQEEFIMRIEDLKSGITKNWFTKMEDANGNVIDRTIWYDEQGKWHERLADGTVKDYDEKTAKTYLHDGRNETSLPEELRINGFWLELDGVLVAPMAVLGYKNNRHTAQVVYKEEKVENGEKIAYTESIITDDEKGASVLVSNTVLDAKTNVIKRDQTWSEWVQF